MALEPVQAAPEEDDAELRDMLLRFKIGLVLSLPVIVLAMGAHVPPIDAIPAKVSAWIQFVFSTRSFFGADGHFLSAECAHS
jgi:Cu+-exporting ATPase